jgi:topoisomerase IV subunit A
LTTDKLKQVNLLEPLPYEEPEKMVSEELEVKGETEIDIDDTQLNDDGQITLF